MLISPGGLLVFGRFTVVADRLAAHGVFVTVSVFLHTLGIIAWGGSLEREVLGFRFQTPWYVFLVIGWLCAGLVSKGGGREDHGSEG